MESQTTYNYKVVRQCSVMTVVWGIVGMLVGVIIAAQLALPELTDGISFLSYGRLRPLHTNAVIFAFGGCALFGTSYYVVQRTCHVRLAFSKLAAFTFWGWQLVILLAAITQSTATGTMLTAKNMSMRGTLVVLLSVAVRGPTMNTCQ